ncbi:ATP-binding protein [Lactiplantibacillus plantarum]|uniref:ATP-binding protein n=1 Tax=Lactiplantibacillus plantarum TaxID=1590 RepID=UPI0018AD51FF|nr:ATP-binding protein [Lactiplantibacillus plantarum]WGF84236.1 ATP-binding protein [Lactiplantibacillus plantarum]WGG41561.1 ATP-binding protein [Lactiplantibacillus plantarum]
MTAIFPGEPSVSNIRAQINGILDSYHRDYDVLSELIQNGVDAIENRYDLDEDDFYGELQIYVNADRKQIKVIDNGNGMSKEMLERSVNLNESGKRKQINTIGEKGVGLSFSIFKSQKAIIRSNDGNKGYRIVGKGAANWLNDTDDVSFKMPTSEDKYFDKRGTEVELSGLELGELFKLSWDQLVFVIRTLTAAGDTNVLFGKNKQDIKITLEYLNSELGIQGKTARIPFEYYMFDGIDESQRVEFDEFEQKFSYASKTDTAKREFFKGKYVVMRGQRQTAKRTVPWIAVFAPNSDDWETRNQKVKLASKGEYKLLVEPEYAHLRSWATLSVKGMPTGIELPTSHLTGALGYLPRMSVLIQDDGANFDLGRKTVKGSTTATYKDIIKEAFNKYKSIASKYIVKDRRPTLEGEVEDRSIKFNQLRSLPKMTDFEQNITNFENIPDQEGTISAIFFELLGCGKFQDLKLYRHGYSEQYDLYAQQNLKDLTLDFKQRLSGFVDDTQKNVKHWSDLNFLVMWCLDESDNEVANDNGIDITNNEEPDVKHLLATAYLTTQMSSETIYVIELKKIIEKMMVDKVSSE